MFRRILNIVAPCFMTPVIVFAQAISCPKATRSAADKACIIYGRSTQPGQGTPVLIHVEEATGPTAGAVVTLTPKLGFIEKIVTTDVKGDAIATWQPDPAMREEDVAIDAEVAIGKRVGAIAFLLKTGAAPTSSMRPNLASGNNQSWFQGRQLRYATRVSLPINAEAECEKTKVAFKAVGTGGETTPDTVFAEFDMKASNCSAFTRWKLSPTVGDQFMRASIVGSTGAPVQFAAGSRKEPWLAAGLAFAYTGSYIEQTKSIHTSVLQRKSGDSTITTSDTTKTYDAPATVGSKWSFAPTLGINTPVYLGWTRVRVSVSTDARNPTTDWYAGISVPQWFNGIWSEDMGVDFQVVAHFARRDEVVNAFACNGPSATKCDVESHAKLVGLGANLQLNASSFLATFVGLFPK